jgi:hypothetical protein
MDKIVEKQRKNCYSMYDTWGPRRPRATWLCREMPTAKCSTNFTSKELREPSASHSEGSQILMKIVFLLVGGQLPQLLGGENAIAFEDSLEMENKKRTGWRVQ